MFFLLNHNLFMLLRHCNTQVSKLPLLFQAHPTIGLRIFPISGSILVH